MEAGLRIIYLEIDFYIHAFPGLTKIPETPCLSSRGTGLIRSGFFEGVAGPVCLTFPV